MREVETDLQINDGLADNAEAEVAWLDDAGMHGANWNFVDTFAPHGLEGEGRAVVLELWPDSVFA
jgi:hypothetical protein